MQRPASPVAHPHSHVCAQLKHGRNRPPSKRAPQTNVPEVLTPAHLHGRSFESKFPTRVFDVGIAEQHAVTFAAGLACEGLVPFCTIYSTFLQRGYDQIVHDVSLQKLPGA